MLDNDAEFLAQFDQEMTRASARLDVSVRKLQEAVEIAGRTDVALMVLIQHLVHEGAPYDIAILFGVALKRLAFPEPDLPPVD